MQSARRMGPPTRSIPCRTNNAVRSTTSASTILPFTRHAPPVNCLTRQPIIAKIVLKAAVSRLALPSRTCLDFECTTRRTGMYGVGCSDVFWWCWSGQATRHTCVKGLYFDEVNGECTYKPWVAACGGERPLTTSPASDTVETTTSKRGCAHMSCAHLQLTLTARHVRTVTIRISKEFATTTSRRVRMAAHTDAIVRQISNSAPTVASATIPKIFSSAVANVSSLRKKKKVC
jgi:hypothetical protein